MVKLSHKINVSISDLWVNTNDRLSDFYASSWQRGDSPVPLLVLRMFLAAIAIAIFVWSLVDGGTYHWLIFLTNWGVLLVVMMMLSAVVVSFAAVARRSFETTRLPWYVSIYWLLINTTLTLSIMITALYWVLLYDPEISEEKGQRAFYLDVMTHGVLACVAFAELLLSRTPVRLLHMYQPLGLGFIYAIFTVIYYAAGGTDREGNPYIYPVLNWNDDLGSASIVVTAALATLIIVYLAIWAIAQCRDRFTIFVIRTTCHDFPPTPPDKHTRIV